VYDIKGIYYYYFVLPEETEEPERLELLDAAIAIRLRPRFRWVSQGALPARSTRTVTDLTLDVTAPRRRVFTTKPRGAVALSRHPLMSWVILRFSWLCLSHILPYACLPVRHENLVKSYLPRIAC